MYYDDLEQAYELYDDYEYDSGGLTVNLSTIALWIALLAAGACLWVWWGKEPASSAAALRSALSKPQAAPAGAWKPSGDSEGWCVDWLPMIDAVPQSQNVGACVSWIQAEGTYQTINNPLNTTLDYSGVVRLHNDVGVKVYDTRQRGLEANAKTILQSGHGYEAIIAGLRANDAEATLQAVEASEWGTGGLSLEVWRNQLKAKYTGSGPSAAPASSAHEAITLPADVQAVVDSVRALVIGRISAGLPAAAPAPAAPANAPLTAAGDVPAASAPAIPGKKADVIPNWQSHVNGRFDSYNCDAWGMQGCIHYGTDIVGNGEGTQVFAPFNGAFASCQDNGEGGAYIGIWIVYIDEKGGEILINHFRELGNWCNQPAGTPIHAGDLLGTMRGDANHVHMQVTVDGELRDFEKYYAEY